MENMINMNKKTPIIIGTSALATMLLVVSITSQYEVEDTFFATANPQITQSPEYIETPTNMPILVTVTDKKSSDEYIQISNNLFGVEGKFSDFGSMIVVTDGENDVTFFDNGGLFFVSEKWSDADYESTMLTDEEYITIANNYLDQLRNSGFIPSDPSLKIEVDDVQIGSDSTFVTAEGEIFDKKIHYVNVNYKQTYMGYPLYGGASDISISIGKDGEVLAFFGFWRDVIPSEESLALRITSEQAVETIAKENRFGAPVPDPTEVIIESVSPGYWFNAADDNSDTHPSWIITGKVIGKDNYEDSFEQKVQMN